MSVPSNTHEFLAIVRKSGIINEKHLTTCLEQIGPSALGSEPKKLAVALIRQGALTRFQAEQFLLGKFRGFTIGNYKVVERLGTGTMALVYLCVHLSMRRWVAIKVLPNATAHEASALKRFFREARAASILDHPNIIRTFDICLEDDRYFLVMEYLEGALLSDLVKKFGPLNISRAAHYIRQTATGLQYAHKQGLVHRDIKPENLIVDRTGTVKILDMGLALICGGSEEVLTQGVIGTPDYLAPEQCQDSHAVDIRADIYSLGGTLYYLLTGQPPFPGGTMAQKLMWHQNREPRPVRERRPEVPAELAAVVAKMLAKKPEDRYLVPADVIAALEPWTQTPVPVPSEEELPRLYPALFNNTNVPPINVPTARPHRYGSPSDDTNPTECVLGEITVVDPPPDEPNERTPVPKPAVVVPPAQPPSPEPPVIAVATQNRVGLGVKRPRRRRQLLLYGLLIFLTGFVATLAWTEIVRHFFTP